MNAKQICPPNCPGRYPGCGANCEHFQRHRAESAKRYERNAMDSKIRDVMYGTGRRRR